MSAPILAGRSLYDFAAEFLIFFFGLGIFLVPSPMPFNWWIIPSVAILLFSLEHIRGNGDNLRAALAMGAFLMIFDFAFENIGTWLGFWGTYGSSLFVLAVPIEVMLTCLFGGAAWYMYVTSVSQEAAMRFKERFNRSIILPLIMLDLLFFGIGGSAAEWSLIQRGFMYYSNGWSTYHALLAYFSVWAMLHAVAFAFKHPLLTQAQHSREGVSLKAFSQPSA